MPDTTPMPPNPAQVRAFSAELFGLSPRFGREPVTFACMVTSATQFVGSGEDEDAFVEEARATIRHARSKGGGPQRSASAFPDIPAAEFQDHAAMQRTGEVAMEIVRLGSEFDGLTLGLATLAVAGMQSANAGDSEDGFCRLARLTFALATDGLARVSGASA